MTRNCGSEGQRAAERSREKRCHIVISSLASLASAGGRRRIADRSDCRGESPTTWLVISVLPFSVADEERGLHTVWQLYLLEWTLPPTCGWQQCPHGSFPSSLDDGVVGGEDGSKGIGAAVIAVGGET